MLESEANISNKELRREKIRERYKGSNSELLEVIPGKKAADFYDDVERRVAVYVRVSTDNLQQTSSYELQKNYYEEKVSKNPNWTLVGIYADEGISGTSLLHREAFNRMIEDCKAGKIDMIITKSVSRFARNIVDCISIVRQLSSLKNPVGVRFETEGIFTLNDNTEMSLSFTATIAQEESHIKSSIMNSSIEMRFGRGIVLTPVLLGYDHDEDGKLTINEKEAKTVRLIFFMYLYGYSCQEIAKSLTELGRQTKKGNTTWNAGSVLEILRNERHCGEILTRKTYTPSYLDHKSKKNRGERAQHRWKGDHEPIISKDDFIAVQHLINNAKYGNKGILPELKVIPEGALKGFISINPRWAGFKADDYLYIAKTVCENEEQNENETIQIEVQGGDFDYRGFEIAREQFFNNSDKLSVTFSLKSMKFSYNCVKKLADTQFIELLIHPLKKLLIVRAADSKNKNAMKWLFLNGKGDYISHPVSGTAFLKNIYDLLGWNGNCKYRVRGIRKQNGDESLLIFSLEETELYLPKDTEMCDVKSDTEITSLAETGKSVIAYPSAWGNNFGSNYYHHSQAEELQRMKKEKDWNMQQEITSFSDYLDLNVTSREEAEDNIQTLINDMKMEETNDG